MARTRSMTAMISDLRIVADIVNRLARHPDSQLERWLNQSIQRLREIVSDNGHEHYLVHTGSATLAAGSQFFTLPTEHLRTYGVDIEDNGSSWSLEDFAFRERNDFGGLVNGVVTQKGPPQFYRLFFHTALTGGGTNNMVGVIPVADKDYSYRLWYLPVWTDITGAAIFDGVAGWEDWPMWDAAVKVAARDKNAELYQMAAGERAKLEAFIVKTAPKRNRNNAGRRLDTRNIRSAMRARARNPGWPP